MKKVLVSLLAACVLTVSTVSTTGCIGSFTAFSKLGKWNKRITNNKFINWIIFVLLWAPIPAYELALAADSLIFNSLEFWTGSSPIALGDTYHETDANGNSVTAVKMEDGSLYMRLDAASGESQELVLQQDEEIVRILDAKGNLLKEAAYAE